MPEPAAPRERERQISLGAFAQLSLFSANGTWLPGGGLTLSYGVGRFVFSADATVLTLEHEVPLGSTRTWLAYAQPGLARVWSWEHAELQAGAGFALGLTRLTGNAEGSAAHDGTLGKPFLAPTILARVATPVGRGFAAFVKLQAGWTLVPVIGQVPDGKDIQIRGLCATLALGTSYGFGEHKP